MEKVLTAIFIILGSLLSLSFLAQVPETISLLPTASSGGHQVGLLIGSFLTLALNLVLIYFLFFKYAFKWLRK
ncbi:MAG TPA: hypothetical protein VL443_16810, partial [Cyclobacteriaceae bacterium]|nr:hypothetical protein [Cyclobacteriaceae bacterium]